MLKIAKASTGKRRPSIYPNTPVPQEDKRSKYSSDSESESTTESESSSEDTSSDGSDEGTSEASETTSPTESTATPESETTSTSASDAPTTKVVVIKTNRQLKAREDLKDLQAKNKPKIIETKHKSEDEIVTSARDKARRRRKHRPITICLTHCRYELVKSMSNKYGLIKVSEDTAWNVYWTDYSVSLERAVEMKRFQIVNHFPGMNEICRKDLLARNLNRMKRVFPNDYNIYPMTWCLPADNNELHAYSRTRRGKTYICKPEMGCQGRGIFLVKNIKDLNPFGRIICQVYIPKPFLIDYLKFDLRIYVLITSCDPLRIWVYKEGLARFATAKYRQPTQTNTENSYMHLTNYAVNKFSRDFIIDEDNGTKRKLTTVYKILDQLGHDVGALEKEINDVILKTILSAQPILKHHYRTCFPQHDVCSACFEILGFDILLDHKLKPFVIEVNHSPSFHTDTKLDREIKEALLNDTFAMLHFKHLDRIRIEREDRRRAQERLSIKLNEVKNLINGKKDGNKTNKKGGATKGQKPEETPDNTTNNKMDYNEIQFRRELEHCGDYRLVFPTEDSGKYDIFLAQNQLSLYQETAASQARTNLTRAKIDEFNVKKHVEEQKRSGTYIPSAQPSKDLTKDKVTVRPESATNPELKPKKKMALTKPVNNSVLPVNPGNEKVFTLSYIVSSEECDRCRGLIQRGLLIRSLGIELQVYQLLCKVGSLKKPQHEEFRRRHGFILTNY